MLHKKPFNGRRSNEKLNTIYLCRSRTLKMWNVSDWPYVKVDSPKRR